MDEDFLETLKAEYIKNFSPRVRAGELYSENGSLQEREDDSRRRKLVDEYYKLLVDNVNDAKKELKKVGNILEYIFDYTNIFERYGMVIAFKKFTGDEQGVHGFWIESEKRMEINIERFPAFVSCIKRKDYKSILNHFEETICHELIHMYDYQRYRREFQPGDFKNALNNPPEFEAYYQQYARKMDKKAKTITNRPDFYKIMGNHAGDFINGFWTSIPVEMAELIKDSRSFTNKWNRRLFQLYHELLKKI